MIPRVLSQLLATGGPNVSRRRSRFAEPIRQARVPDQDAAQFMVGEGPRDDRPQSAAAAAASHAQALADELQALTSPPRR